MSFDVCVVGSLNLDLVSSVDRAPAAGETLTGHDFKTVPGGKGANQAVAAASLGLRTAMVGRVGDDAFGPVLRRALQDRAVDVAGVALDPGAATGTATILVEGSGQNRIVVVPGANGRVGDDDLDRMPDAAWLVLQLEIPLDTVIAAVKRARSRDMRVILNPAPARPLPDDLYGQLDVIVVNEIEAETLTGVAVNESSLPDVAAVFHRRGARTVALTLGERGAFASGNGGSARIAAPKVEVIDTTAAGDAFIGGLAAGLIRGASLEDTLSLGVAAGTLTVTRPGAQPSIPTLDEVNAFRAR
jgi:ribokinase